MKTKGECQEKIIGNESVRSRLLFSVPRQERPEQHDREDGEEEGDEAAGHDRNDGPAEMGAGQEEDGDRRAGRAKPEERDDRRPAAEHQTTPARRR